MINGKLLYVFLVLVLGSIFLCGGNLAMSRQQMRLPDTKLQGTADEEGNKVDLVEEWIFGEESHYIERLPIGNYVLVEKRVSIGMADEENSDIEEEDSFEEETMGVFIATDETVWAKSHVNVRQFPDKDSKKKGTLNAGFQIKRTGVGDNGWSRVIYMDEECYINSRYLSTEDVTAHTTLQIPEPADESQGSFSSGVISAEGSVDGNFISLCETYFNKLPQNVRLFLQNNGIHIYITDTNLSNRFFAGKYKSVMGCTVYEDKAIYLENRKNAITESIIHETGHMIDYLVGWASSTDEFNEIYLLEKDSFVEVNRKDDHSTSSVEEYFAEVLNQSILYPDSCSKNSPRSYEYIMNKINGL